VATDIADVNTVAADSTAINAVADNAANINTVAGIDSDVTTVAGIASDVTIVATNVADITNFSDVYQGPKSTPPTLRNDGGALQLGDLYFNTVSNAMFVYASTGWVPAGSSVNGTSRRFRYISTAGQTTFTGADSNGNTMAYDAGFVDVYLNGVRLDQTDYTASSGTSVVLGSAAALNDELNIVAFGTFSVAEINGVDLINGTVTYNKIQNVTAGKLLGRDTSGAGVLQELPIAVDSSGKVGFGTTTPLENLDVRSQNSSFGLSASSESNVFIQSGYDAGTRYLTRLRTDFFGVFSIATGSGSSSVAPSANSVTNRFSITNDGLLQFNSGYGSVATAYGCRAWVNFNGTGTVAIRASGNVSSITDNGAGDYTVNFTTAMPDANYAISAMARNINNSGGGTVFLQASDPTTSGARIETGAVAGVLSRSDLPIVTVVFFR
jgi:hypothetical protein